MARCFVLIGLTSVRRTSKQLRVACPDLRYFDDGHRWPDVLLEETTKASRHMFRVRERKTVHRVRKEKLQAILSGFIAIFHNISTSKYSTE